MLSSKTIRASGLAVFMWVLATGSLFAGTDNLPVKKRAVIIDYPRATLKINPTCLLNLARPSLFFSSDIWLAKHWVIEPGAGWFFAAGRTMYHGESLHGFRGRLGIKYMILERQHIKPYIGLEGKYNYLNETMQQEVCRYGCQYTQVLPLHQISNIGGLALKGGSQFYFLKSKQLVLEVYLGFGFKYCDIQKVLPEDASEVFAGFGPPDPVTNWMVESRGKRYMFDMLLGVNIGYAFKKKTQ